MTKIRWRTWIGYCGLATLLVGLSGCVRTEYDEGYDAGVHSVRRALGLIEGEPPIPPEEMPVKDPLDGSAPPEDKHSEKWEKGFRDGVQAEMDRHVSR